MAYAHKNAEGEWVEIKGDFVLIEAGTQQVLAPNQEPDQPPKYITVPDDMRCSYNWPQIVGKEVAEAHGVFEIDENWHVPLILMGEQTIADVWGVPTRVCDLDCLKASCLAALKEAYETAFGGGFPVNIEGNNETLQMRPNDQVNWLIFKDTCNDAIMAGIGDTDCPQPLRCTSNAEYVVTFNEGAQIMRDMKVWGGSLMRQLWLKKDEINSAADRESLAAIELVFNV